MAWLLYQCEYCARVELIDNGCQDVELCPNELPGIHPSCLMSLNPMEQASSGKLVPLASTMRPQDQRHKWRFVGMMGFQTPSAVRAEHRRQSATEVGKLDAALTRAHASARDAAETAANEITKLKSELAYAQEQAKQAGENARRLDEVVYAVRAIQDLQASPSQRVLQELTIMTLTRHCVIYKSADGETEGFVARVWDISPGRLQLGRIVARDRALEIVQEAVREELSQGSDRSSSPPQTYPREPHEDPSIVETWW